MIYELRTYTLRPGAVAEYLALCAREAALLKGKYGTLIGWWQTEVGPLNEVVHLWAFADLTERTNWRVDFAGNPELDAFRKRAVELVVSQSNKLLKAAPFSPLQ